MTSGEILHYRAESSGCDLLEGVQVSPLRRAHTVARLLAPAALAHRAKIAWGLFLDHQFERSSPIPPLPEETLHAIGRHEITLPPTRLLGGSGNQTVEGLLFLASLARALGARRIFEIGTFNGLTTWTLARNLHGAIVDTLDLPAGRQPLLPLAPLDEQNRSQPLSHVYDELPAPSDIVQHWSDSAVFDFSPWRSRCDLVYVDGAHSREYVASDTRNALAMVSERGAVVWDDYWRQEPGVKQVLEGLRDVDLYRVPGTRLVVHLRPDAAHAVSL